MIKVYCEIFKKITLERIVAVAKNGFILEMLFIMPQFIFYILQTSVIFVLFCDFCRGKAFIIGYGASQLLAPQQHKQEKTPAEVSLFTFRQKTGHRDGVNYVFPHLDHQDLTVSRDALISNLDGIRTKHVRNCRSLSTDIKL